MKKKNSIPPKLYGLPKTHKEGVLIRSVVSFISSPTYKLAKYLNLWLYYFTDFELNYAVKNSAELIEKISDYTPPLASIICSFDVASLFTYVPLASTLQRLMNSQLRNLFRSSRRVSSSTSANSKIRCTNFKMVSL